MHGGIWRFKDSDASQTVKEGQRYVTGLGNMVAIAGNYRAQALFGVMMGRDQLYGNWAGLFTVKQRAELPGEEFLRIEKGGNCGWPYCYYDGLRHKLVLAPEYGGMAARWALAAGSAFPLGYRGGAFVSFHGSWNRAPLPQKVRGGPRSVREWPSGRSALPKGPWGAVHRRFPERLDLARDLHRIRESRIRQRQAVVDSRVQGGLLIAYAPDSKARLP